MTTFYLDPVGGNNNNIGTNINAPWGDLQSVLEMKLLTPHTVLILLDGYHGELYLSSRHNLIIKSQHNLLSKISSVVLINCSNVTMYGLSISPSYRRSSLEYNSESNSIIFDSCHYTTLTDCEVFEPDQSKDQIKIIVSNSGKSKIQRTRLSNCSGVQIMGVNPASSP